MGASMFDSLVTIKRSGKDGARYEFSERPWASVGSHDDCDILIHAEGVALLHALVTTAENDEPRLYGLDTELPVSIPERGLELRDNTYAPIHHGDVFYCGERGFRFERKDADRVNISAKKQRRSSVKKRKSTKRTARKSMVITDADEKFVDGPADAQRSLIQAQRLSMGAHEIASAIAEDNDLPTPAAFDADGNENKEAVSYKSPEKAAEVDTSHLKSLDVQLSPLPITTESFYTNTPTSDAARKSMIGTTPLKGATPIRTRTPGRVAVKTPERTRTPLRVIGGTQSQSSDESTSTSSSAESEQVTVAVSSMRATPKKPNASVTSITPAVKKQRNGENKNPRGAMSAIRPPTRLADIRRGNTPARPMLGTKKTAGPSSFTPRRNPPTPAKKTTFTPKRNPTTLKPKFTPGVVNPPKTPQFTPRRIPAEQVTEAEVNEEKPKFTPKRLTTPGKSATTTPGKQALSGKKLFTPSRRAVLAVPDVDEYATRLSGFKSPAKKSPLSEPGSASKPKSNKLVAKTPGLAPLTFTPSPPPVSSPRLHANRPAFKAEVAVGGEEDSSASEDVMEDHKKRRRSSARRNLEKGVFTKSPIAHAPASPWVHTQHGGNNNAWEKVTQDEKRGVVADLIAPATTSNDSEITPADTAPKTKQRKSRASAAGTRTVNVNATEVATAMERTPKKKITSTATTSDTPRKPRTPSRKTPTKKNPNISTPVKSTPKPRKTIMKTPVRGATPGRTPGKARVKFAVGMELEAGPHYSPADKTPAKQRVTVAATVPGAAPTSTLASLGTFFFPASDSLKNANTDDEVKEKREDESMDDVSDNDVASPPADTQPEVKTIPKRRSLTERLSALFFSPPAAPQPPSDPAPPAADVTEDEEVAGTPVQEEEKEEKPVADSVEEEEEDTPSKASSVEASPALSEEASSGPEPRRRSLIGGVRFLASGVLKSLVHSPARSLLGIEVEEDEDTEDTMQNATDGTTTEEEKVPEIMNTTSDTPKSTKSAARDVTPKKENGASTPNISNDNRDTRSNLIDRFNNAASNPTNRTSTSTPTKPMDQDDSDNHDDSAPDYTPATPASLKSKSPKLEAPSSDSEDVTPLKPGLDLEQDDMDLDAFEKPMDTSDAITNDNDDSDSDASTVEEKKLPVEEDKMDEDNEKAEDAKTKSKTKDDKPAQVEEKEDAEEKADDKDKVADAQEPTDYSKWTVKDLKKYLTGVDISVKGMKKADLIIAAQKAAGTHAEDKEEDEDEEEPGEDSDESFVEESPEKAKDEEDASDEDNVMVEDDNDKVVDAADDDDSAVEEKKDLRPVLMKLTVAKLRSLLKSINGDEKGKKTELVDRLLEMQSVSAIKDLLDGGAEKEDDESGTGSSVVAETTTAAEEEEEKENMEVDDDNTSDGREDRGKELKGFTVKKLQGMLGKLKLDKAGKKGELIERLLDHEFEGTTPSSADNDTGSEDETEAPEEEKVDNKAASSRKSKRAPRNKKKAAVDSSESEDETEEEEVDKVAASRKSQRVLRNKKAADNSNNNNNKVVAKKNNKIDDADLGSMTVAKLRAYLKKHKAPTNGLKAALLQRATHVQNGTYEGDNDG